MYPMQLSLVHLWGIWKCVQKSSIRSRLTMALVWVGLLIRVVVEESGVSVSLLLSAGVGWIRTDFLDFFLLFLLDGGLEGWGLEFVVIFCIVFFHAGSGLGGAGSSGIGLSASRASTSNQIGVSLYFKEEEAQSMARSNLTASCGWGHLVSPAREIFAACRWCLAQDHLNATLLYSRWEAARI